MKNFALIGVLILSLTVYAGIHFHLGRSRVLRIGSECDYPPNNWEEERDTDSNVPIANREGRFAEGYDIQIAKTVADAMGAKLEVYKLDWNELIGALTEKKIDAIFSSMLDTTDRKKYIAFSNVYEDRLAEYNVIVNCTPVGMFPKTEECPLLPYEAMDSRTILYDLIYNPDRTLFMKRGAEYGANVKNGLEMLLLQAFSSWEFWHDKE